MTISVNQHKAIAIILFLSLTVFLRLGSGEIQPGNEGYNAMKAKSFSKIGIINNNYNFKNIYPSSLPDLNIIAISVCMSVFGEGAFAIRFFSALCSAMALVFFYLISRRFLSYSSSIIALFIISGTVVWNNYARQAMNDIPAITFIIAAIYFILKIFETKNKKRMIIYSLLYSVSLVSTLLTNPIASILPLTFAGFFFLNKDKKKQILFLLLGLSIALFTALFIFFFILSKYDFNFINSIENVLDLSNYTHIGLLSFFNQLIIANPFLLFGFLYIFIAYKKINKTSENVEHGKLLNNLLSYWFFLLLIILSDAMLNYQNSILYIIPPAILLALKLFDNFHIVTKSNRIVLLILTLLITFFLWSYIYELRFEIELLFTKSQYYVLPVLFIIIFIALILTTIILPKKIIDKISHPALYYSITFIPYLMIFKVILLNLAAHNSDSYGAVKTADLLYALKTDSFVYVYHETKKSDSINTQLDWYSDGWLSGNRKMKSCIKLKMPKNNIDYRSLRFTDDYPDLPIVYYKNINIDITSGVIKDLLSARRILLKNSNYIIFGRKNLERNYDKSI